MTSDLKKMKVKALQVSGGRYPGRGNSKSSDPVEQAVGFTQVKIHLSKSDWEDTCTLM